MSWDAYFLFKISGVFLFIAGGSWYAHKAHLPFLKTFFVAVFAVVCGYFGSSTWYILQNENTPIKSIAEWAALMDSSGSVLYGWIAGATVAVYVLSKILKLPTAKVFYILLPWALGAQILNRFGCFSGQCCWGSGCSLPWAVYNDFEGIRVHPVQLYEAAWDAALLWLLLRVRPDCAEKRIFIYYAGYPLGRFFIEFFRGDNQPAWLGLTVPQVTSLLFLAAVASAWLFRSKPSPPSGTW